MENSNDKTDGAALDEIILAVSKLRELLKADIDSLNLPHALKVSIKLLKTFIDFLNQSKLLKTLKDASSKKHSSKKCTPIEGSGSNVEGDQLCTVWIKKNIGPALIGRPVPNKGIGVKKMPSKRNKGIKIKKLLSQPKMVTVKKNGQVLRKMTVRRKAYFPGRRRKIY